MIQPDEKISAIVPVDLSSETHYLVMATKNGIIKKTRFEEYANIRKNGLNAIVLREDDQLIDVRQAVETDDVLLISKKGQSIRFHLSDIRETGRVSMGVVGMKLDEDDEVVSMQLSSDGADLLTISENGMGKKTPIDEFGVQHRGGKGLKCHKITEKTGLIKGAMAINPGDEIMLINSEGIVIRINTDTISTLGRNTSGVKLIDMDLDHDVTVASITKVLEEESENTEEIEQSEEEVSSQTEKEE